MKMLCKVALFITLLTNIIFAQQTDLEKGIELYKQGNNSAAISLLEKLSKQKETKNEPKVWNYLGLAYIEKGDLKKARKALEKANSLNSQNSAFRTNLGYAYLLSNKIDNSQLQLNEAIRLEPQNFLAYYIRGTSFFWEKNYDRALGDAENAIIFQVNFSSAYILKADILTAKFGQRIANGSTARDEISFLRQAVEILETCMKTCQGTNLQMPQERLESLKVFYEYFSKIKPDNKDLNTAAEVNAVTGNNENLSTAKNLNDTPLKILSKQHPNYTDKARQAGISGTITLYVLFAASGKISNVITIQALGYGLDEEAIKAARKMTFQPQTENGKPVSVVKMVAFTFTIY